MYPKLLHIYGPLEINSFNAAILLGIVVFFYAALRHPGLEKLISKTDFLNISIESALAGILGGRVLHLISAWQEYNSFFQMISIWNGGLSILGAIAGIALYALWSLKRRHLPIAALFDIAALYAPLIHGIARIGCFLAGCCYGCSTTMPWGITYTNPLVAAPLNVHMHPTQLYSSLLFFGIFIGMYLYAQRAARLGQKRPGELSLIYLMAMSIERWFVDFFRGDRIMLIGKNHFAFFSFHQWLALGVFISALIAFMVLRSSPRHRYESV